MKRLQVTAVACCYELARNSTFKGFPFIEMKEAVKFIMLVSQSKYSALASSFSLSSMTDEVKWSPCLTKIVFH